MGLGLRFARLIVIGNAPAKPWGNLCSTCICDCGNEVIVTDSNLRTGNTKSCGCLKLEVNKSGARERFTRHGFARMNAVTPTWKSWRAMHDRCLLRKHHAWKNYGGRGIRICDRWLNSFEVFLKDMGERPGREFSIDRINPDGNYEPGNCRWADRLTQRRNRRKTQ